VERGGLRLVKRIIVAGNKSEAQQDGRAWPLVWRYGPPAAWMAFMFFASTGAFSGENTSRIVRPLLLWLFPDIGEEKILLVHFITRKAAHFLEYGVLALLAARAFSASPGHLLRRRWFLISLLLVVIYSLSDEYHQSFVPSRGASIYDSLIDTLGGLTSLLLYYAWRGRRRAKHESL
jgi:VanZ family protein